MPIYIFHISPVLWEASPIYPNTEHIDISGKAKAIGHEFSLSADRERLLLLLRKHTEPVLLWPVFLALVLSHSVQHKWLLKWNASSKKGMFLKREKAWGMTTVGKVFEATSLKNILLNSVSGLLTPVWIVLNISLHAYMYCRVPSNSTCKVPVVRASFDPLLWLKCLYKATLEVGI